MITDLVSSYVFSMISKKRPDTPSMLSSMGITTCLERGGEAKSRQ
jgi:hypothetical protein